MDTNAVIELQQRRALNDALDQIATQTGFTNLVYLARQNDALTLEGKFTSAQLRAIADLFDKFMVPSEEQLL